MSSPYTYILPHDTSTRRRSGEQTPSHTHYEQQHTSSHTHYEQPHTHTHYAPAHMMAATMMGIEKEDGHGKQNTNITHTRFGSEMCTIVTCHSFAYDGC